MMGLILAPFALASPTSPRAEASRELSGDVAHRVRRASACLAEQLVTGRTTSAVCREGITQDPALVLAGSLQLYGGPITIPTSRTPSDRTTKSSVQTKYRVMSACFGELGI